MERKRAYTIDELAKNGPVGRTHLYQAIKEQRLIARKSGRRTFVLDEDYEAFLQNLPLVGASRPAAS